MRHPDDVAGFLWHLSQFRQVHIAASYGSALVEEVLRRYKARWHEDATVTPVADEPGSFADGWILRAPGLPPDHLLTPAEMAGSEPPTAGDAAGALTAPKLPYTLKDLPPDLLEQIRNLPDLPVEAPADAAGSAGEPPAPTPEVQRALDLLHDCLVTDWQQQPDSPVEILDPADLEDLVSAAGQKTADLTTATRQDSKVKPNTDETTGTDRKSGTE